MSLFESTVMTACAGIDPTRGVRAAPRRKAPRTPAATPAPTTTTTATREESRPFRLRRLDIAKNDCLHPDQWRDAHGQSINADLVMDLAAAQARCQHLFTNNSYYRGVVLTYARHVVGKTGPRLQIQSDNKAFNDTVEGAYKRVMKAPDPAGRLSGVASLKCAVIHTLNGGSSLFVEKAVRRNGPVTFGWQTLHPRRLQTPAKFATDENVVLGKRFDQNGRCTTYYLDESRRKNDVYHLATGQDCKAVSADRVRHFFIDEEGEQVTGLPLMHSAAKPAAAINEYDADVMETAQNQAKTTFLLESNNPEFAADPDPAPEYMNVIRGQGNAVPIGWTSRFPNATQPMAEYVPFRHERLAELGRPIGMPLILVLLSSIDGNFSQAQFDGSLYAEGIGEFQAELDRQVLEWVVESIITELVLGGQAERPADYSLVFSWPKPPHANIEKVVKALRMLVEDGHIAPEHASQVMGYDFEEVVEARRRNAELLELAKLPPAPVNRGSGAAPNDGPDGGPDGGGNEGSGNEGSDGDPPAKKKAAKKTPRKKEAAHAFLA